MHKITTFDNYIKEPTSCAMRGRNPDNPSDRTAGIPTEQRIEVGGDVANCITSVQKDSMIVEPNGKSNDLCVEVAGISVNPTSRKLEFRGNESVKDVSPSLRATDYKCPHTAWEIYKEGNYRIRKLTPRECFRLMGVSDSDIDKIQKAGISRTQQYKLAGNSIVVDVLYYIFKNMFVK